jgi:hypothetical protein
VKAQRAHQVTVERSIADIAGHLQAELGQKLTAHLAGVDDPKAVGRWAKGTRQPRQDSEDRLRVAFQVWHILASEESTHTVRHWFIGLNPQLDDVPPADAIREGDLRDVLMAAKAYSTGG